MPAPKPCVVWCRTEQVDEATRLLGEDWAPKFRNPKYWDTQEVQEALGPAFAFANCENGDAMKAGYEAAGIPFEILNRKSQKSVTILSSPAAAPVPGKTTGVAAATSSKRKSTAKPRKAK
jgi:hypothetical protein